MKNIFFSAILSLLGTVGFCQSGYLGRYNSFNIGMGLTPSLHQTHELKDDQIIVKNHVFYKHFQFAYGRIVGKKSILSINYSFNNLAVNLGEISYGSHILVFETPSGENRINRFDNRIIQIEDLALKRNTIAIDYKYFRKGNLAPIGKFINIGVSYGKSTLEKPYVITGIRDQLEHDYLNKSHHEIAQLDTFRIGNIAMSNDFQINLALGRSIPLSKRLIFTYSFRHSLFQASFLNQQIIPGIPLLNMFFDGVDVFFGKRYANENLTSNSETKSDIIYRYEKGIRDVYHKSNWIVIDFNLSFYL